MKYVLTALLFAPIIYLALKQKRWYLFLAVALVGILPEQFSIRLHDKLPLITASRVLIALVAVFWLIERIREKKFTKTLPILLFGAVNLIVSCINLRYGFGEVNRIFLFVFERVLLVIMVKDLIKTKEEFSSCMDFFIMGSMVLAVIGIVQTVFDYDLSSVLRIQETATSITLSLRMGMTRSYATFNAISYGCYCAFMLLPIYLQIRKQKKLWLSFAFALNFTALICTFTRSAWLCIGFMFLVLLIMERKAFFRAIIPGVAMVVALCIVLCLIQPKLASGLTETGKSAINTILQVLPISISSKNPSKGDSTTPTTDLDSTEPTEPSEPDEEPPLLELDKDFGANANNPTASRMMQWTAVEKMVIDGNFLFGYGYNALSRGMLQFHYANWGSKWVTTTFLDVGLVALLVEGGFVGALSYLALLGYMAVFSFIQLRKQKKEFNFYHLTFLQIPLYLLLNFVAAFLFYQAVWIYIALFFSYQHLSDSDTPVLETTSSDNGSSV